MRIASVTLTPVVPTAVDPATTTTVSTAATASTSSRGLPSTPRSPRESAAGPAPSAGRPTAGIELSTGEVGAGEEEAGEAGGGGVAGGEGAGRVVGGGTGWPRRGWRGRGLGRWRQERGGWGSWRQGRWRCAWWGWSLATPGGDVGRGAGVVGEALELGGPALEVVGRVEVGELLGVQPAGQVGRADRLGQPGGGPAVGHVDLAVLDGADPGPARARRDPGDDLGDLVLAVGLGRGRLLVDDHRGVSLDHRGRVDRDLVLRVATLDVTEDVGARGSGEHLVEA